MIYVALLRGINVGGNNKIEMKKLKVTFERFGCSNVTTYINSGNIIFEDHHRSHSTLTCEIEAGIKEDFGLTIKVLLRDFDNIRNVCTHLPENWVKNEIMRTDVIFLCEDIDDPGIVDELRIKPVDQVKYVSGAVLWNILDKDYTRSAMSNLIGTKIYKAMTIRNVNTVRKIYELMAEVNSAIQ
ncbi:hypothetical protein SDC9_176893 [bioreactor metagenome]|uniref:DUF1697 domain-containing protein n=1 Tax=bioreactor metagenome TaxID=1076179 RepID=A0A645GT26_9ZZZZ|nr:DUF1697 domain-containing protein [Paludibacter sp.]